MAAVDLAPSPRAVRRLGVLRSALTGAAVFAILFGAVWLGALLTEAASHMLMFMMRPVSAAGPLMSGLVSSASAGFLVGALTAAAYNAFAFVDRR
jgi:hypothetical protein